MQGVVCLWAHGEIYSFHSRWLYTVSYTHLDVYKRQFHGTPYSLAVFVSIQRDCLVIICPSFSQDYNLSVSGGNEKGNYYAGLEMCIRDSYYFPTFVTSETLNTKEHESKSCI